MSNPTINLLKFIKTEKIFFKEYYPNLNFDNDKWPLHKIFPNWKYSKTRTLSFTPISKGGIKLKGFNNPPPRSVIPKEVNNIIKALLLFIIRSKNIQSNAADTYLRVLRGIYHVMFTRNEIFFLNVNNDYFCFLEEYYLQSHDKNNAYNACVHLKCIGNLLDEYQLTKHRIMYTPSIMYYRPLVCPKSRLK